MLDPQIPETTPRAGFEPAPHGAEWHERARPVQIDGPVRIVNAEPKYPKVILKEPTGHGYVYVGASIHPGHLPFVLPNAERARVLYDLKAHALMLETRPDVVRALVFRAIVAPPVKRLSRYLKKRADGRHVPRFDTAVLIETTSPQTARELEQSEGFRALIATLRGKAAEVFTLLAHNLKRIADVNATEDGLFLFNHFMAENENVVPTLWEYLAGWYVAETRLRNSIALAPLEGEVRDYPLVNFARWEGAPLKHFWSQLSKPSFWSYVVANLNANRAAAIPIYFRRV